ncbi:hypothetical protein N665_2838s0006 [Sinapis alba]|nr:hypothetical protein N665_2838s0006 [Sinapis alba]
MADSTTAANAETLKLEFKKILTEILSYGKGGSNDRRERDETSRVLMKAIDEANRIINRLREVEPETDILSPSLEKVDVPKEFKCTLSKKIMIEPVIIASGQTYEKRYIKEWLKRERTCPITNQVLSHLSLTPNFLVDELITQWCLVNNFERPKSSEERITELFTDGIDSLLQRISSPSSVEDQTQAAEELRSQTKRFANVRTFFVSELPTSITRLLSPLSALVDSNLELQENIVTTLFNLSIVEKNKTVIAENPLVISLLTRSLKQGTAETRRNSAATLLSLSAINSNRVIIGNSETLKALIGLIGEGGLFTTEAASAVFNVCSFVDNREKAVSAGLIPVVTTKIKEGSNVAELLALLALVSTHNRGVKEMNDVGFISDLLSILRKPSCLVTHENAVVIVFNMCDRRNRDRAGGMEMLREEENQYGTFTKLVKQGSDRAVRKAEAILKWLNRQGTGKQPQKG